MQDLDELALTMPATSRTSTPDGRPSYLVSGKLFCCQRTRRRDALDDTGEMLDDVLMFRVADLETKEALLADTSSSFFTTPHFNGYAAVLIRLERIPVEQLKPVVVEAWLARAPTRLSKEYLDRSR